VPRSFFPFFLTVRWRSTLLLFPPPFFLPVFRCNHADSGLFLPLFTARHMHQFWDTQTVFFLPFPTPLLPISRFLWSWYSIPEASSPSPRCENLMLLCFSFCQTAICSLLPMMGETFPPLSDRRALLALMGKELSSPHFSYPFGRRPSPPFFFFFPPVIVGLFTKGCARFSLIAERLPPPFLLACDRWLSCGTYATVPLFSPSLL